MSARRLSHARNRSYHHLYRHTSADSLKEWAKPLQNNDLNLILRGLFAAAFAAFTLLAPVGCASGDSGPSQDLRAEGRQVFGGANQDGAVVRPPAWRVALAVFSGADAVARANAALPIIQQQGNMPEAFVEPRKSGAIIAVGAYDQPDSRQAQRELERIRTMTINGQLAYPRAFLAPPQGGVSGAIPEWNLASAREQYGSSAKYTLQVAVYESDRRAEAMRLAEQAASTYRRDGELAFYYHGPNRSMVTIGVFRDDDFNPESGRMSRDLQELMARHPAHLVNGMGVRETLGDGTTRMQPPQLVRIP